MNNRKALRDRLYAYDFSPRDGEDWPKYMGRAHDHRDELLGLLREQDRLLEVAREALRRIADAPTSNAHDGEQYEMADFEGAYDQIIYDCRKTIRQTKG